MGLLDFECPLCGGVFRADQKDVEVVCPHCQETIGLAADIEVSNPTTDSEQSSVILTALPVQQAPRLFPPGYKPTKTQSETDEVSPVQDGFSETVDPLKPQELKPQELKPQEPEPEEPEPEEPEPEEPESQEPEPQEPEPQEPEPQEFASESTEDIDELLPPEFQIDEALLESNAAGKRSLSAVISEVEEASEGGMTVNVQVSDEPRTVGHGVNKRELTSRSAEEKAQFKRNKNVILWSVSILIIVLTMIIMLLLF